MIGYFPFKLFYFDNNSKEKETKIIILSSNIELGKSKKINDVYLLGLIFDIHMPINTETRDDSQCHLVFAVKQLSIDVRSISTSVKAAKPLKL